MSIAFEGNNQTRNRDFLIAGSLVLFALSVYLLTYSGLFRSIDELTVYAQTEGFLRGLGTRAPQLLYAAIHHRFSIRFEPFVTLALAPFSFIASYLPGIGNQQAVLLLNAFLTALTTALIWLTVRGLGFSVKTGILAAICFGFATLAWPYSRTLYREPMAAFGLAGALYFFVRYDRAPSRRAAILCFIPLLFSVALRFETVIGLAVFAVVMLLVNRRQLTTLGPVIIVLIFLGIAIFLFNLSYRFPARFSSDKVSPAANFLSRQFHQDWLATGFMGLTISPGKGLFIYAPVLALAPLGIPQLWRRSRRGVVLLVGWSLLSLLFYSTYKYWHGGVAWGPRYIVPLAVPLVILASPLFSRSGLLFYLAGGVMLLSMAIQFVASTANWTVYYEQLVQQFPEGLLPVYLDFSSPGLSPVVGQFQIWHPQNFDILWLRSAQQGQAPLLQPGILIILIILLGLAVLTLYLSLSGRLEPRLGRVLVWDALAFGVGIFIFLRLGYGVDAAYWYTDPTAQRQVAEVINNSSPDPKLIVSVSPDFHYNRVMNFLKGNFLHYWLSPLQEDFDFLAEPMARAGRIMLITDNILPNSAESHLERWLNQEAFRYDAQWIGQYVLFQYAPPQPLTIRQQGPWAWPGITLLEVGLGAEGVRAGEAISLEFTFRAEEGLNRDYSFFVHLIREDGSLLDGEDAPPGYGANPTSSWKVGEIMKDRRALLVPPDLEERGYLIEVGFTVEGERVLPDTGEGITSWGTVLVSRIYVTGTR